MPASTSHAARMLAISDPSLSKSAVVAVFACYVAATAGYSLPHATTSQVAITLMRQPSSPRTPSGARTSNRAGCP
jgi:hypothetical protein